jgi:ABC-2 type transport system ATP-binding protein
MKARGTTLILSSHQMWQLEELCSQFCIIAAGENRAQGTLDELRAAWQTRTLRVAPGTGGVRALLERQAGGSFIADNDGKLDFSLPADTDFAALLRSLVGAEAITSYEVIEPSLHDIYIRATEQVPA